MENWLHNQDQHWIPTQHQQRQRYTLEYNLIMYNFELNLTKPMKRMNTMQRGLISTNTKYLNST